MKWLLWKDYRHNRLIVLTALLLLLLPHVGAIGVIFWANVYGHFNGALEWKLCVAVACLYSIGLSMISLALIGGNAIAGERADRSAEFLFSLPIARRKLLASKLILALVVAAAPWLTNLPLLLMRTTWLPRDVRLPDVLAFIAMWELTAFCVSWFVTSLVASGSLATLAGLLTAPVVVYTLMLIAVILRLEWDDAFIKLWWCIICLTLAPLCFVVGTWHYLRRVEP